MQDLFSGILAQTQPKQNSTATETITRLCDRLLNSTLLEDRRAAVLGLKGFCREYREAVVAGGLRGLITELQRDRLDSETVRATLETILLLFLKDKTTNTNEVDYIALWLADEFTQHEEHISLLIDIFENHDFYVRLYALQLLGAILLNRPERTQQCVFAAPLGISRLVSTLDDAREAIQNEAVILLVKLVDRYPDIQKLVAFENTFDKIFNMIEREGGVEGGIVVRDCLNLIANLLRFNSSNQNYFRETSCIPRLSDLMVVQKGASNWDNHRVKNTILVLEICRLFVVEGSLETHAHQDILFQAGVLMNVLRLAFADSTHIQVRALALVATGDLIRGNKTIQESFSNIDVPYINASALSEANVGQPEPEVIPVTQALLNWALGSSFIYAFDLRVGASVCLEGYFSNNNETRRLLLEDAVEAYFNDNTDSKNFKLLSGILDHETDFRTDPYKTWFSCIIMLHIFEGGKELKDIARSITIGDQEQGEEVVTAIQTVSANLVASLQFNLDARIPVAYTMLLNVWLYEDYEAIDDFLSEGSSVQSLVANVSQSASKNVLVEGMCTSLLAVLYGFCTIASPISRPVLHRLIVSRIGRDTFVSKLRLLRQNSFVRDFDPAGILSTEKDETGLPNAFFNRVFIDFFKDNYSRLIKVLDRDPNRDPISVDAVEAQNESIIQNMETMRVQLEELQEALEKEKNEKKNTEQILAQRDEIISEMKQDQQSVEFKLKQSGDVYKNLQSTLATTQRELQQEKDKYQKIEQNLRSTAQTLVQETGKSERKIKELEESFRKSVNKNEQLEREIDKVKEKARTSESNLRSLKESYNQEKSKLDSRLKELEGSNSYTHSMLQDLEKQKKQLDSNVDLITKQKSTLEILVKNLQTQRAESESKLKDLQSKYSELETKFLNLDSERASHDSQVKELEAELEKQKSVIENFQAERSTTSEEIENIKSEKTSLESKVEELASKNTELLANNEDISNIKSDKGLLENKVQNLEKNKNELESECEKLRQQVAAFEKSKIPEKNGLKNNGVEKERSKLEELERQLKDAKRQLKDSEKKLIMSDHAVKESEDKFRKLEEKQVNGETELSQLRDRLESEKAEVSRLTINLKDSEEQMENMLLLLADLEENGEKKEKDRNEVEEEDEDDEDDDEDADEDEDEDEDEGEDDDDDEVD
ncbi:p115 like vesicle tethering protein [Lipomyces japonicus]|uniref:p115 like vesicle tethering protein n=1 Tax=Lipomyces japonicus TaxID=56871 RepID=UPI0034CFF332